MIYLTSDLHFGHYNIIKYCNRPFLSVEDMDNEMIKRWNSKVSPNDIVYVVGDFAISKSPSYYFQKLNGKKHLIKGNHDGKKTLSLPWNSISDLLEIKYNNKTIVCCHYAMRVWNKKHYGTLHAYGHSHNTLPAWEGALDVGVDAHNFYPISVDEFINMTQFDLKINENRNLEPS